MTRDGLRLFYAAAEAIGEGRVSLGAAESAHIRRVLRMRAGARCRVATEDGREYLVELTDISPKGSAGAIIERLPARPPAPLFLSVGIPLLKGERFEWTLQKGCELGVCAFHPLLLERCEARVREERSAERQRRWRRILLEAARQCDRVPPPAAHPPGGLEDYLAATQEFDLKLMGHLGEGALPLGEGLAQAGGRGGCAPLRAAILTGPEGDLAEAESRRATDAGFLPVSLGPRVLRADTAPVALIAIAQHALGDVG